MTLSTMNPGPNKGISETGAVVRKQIEDLSVILKNRPTNVSKQPDRQSTEEVIDLESERKRAEIKAANQDTTERKRYSLCSFILVCVWLLAIAIVVVLQGFKLWGFSLDNNVVIALIGGTTTGVVGIF